VTKGSDDQSDRRNCYMSDNDVHEVVDTNCTYLLTNKYACNQQHSQHSQQQEYLRDQERGSPVE
jgi:hypothetical protein